MTGRKAIGLAVCALALGCFSNLSSAHAQGQAPFTIRRPSDGATVREKQRIEIPRGSIKPGGFVALYLDGKFYLALAPEDEEGGADRPFTFFWDTKGTGISDGEHTLRAVLYEPAGSTSGVAVTETGHSEVRLTVANKIKDGPDSVLLRYRYREGDNLEYGRNGKAIVVSAGSANNKFGDEELSSVKSTLQLAVEDVRFDPSAQTNISLVRNKLTSLAILDGNEERVLDRSQLSSSMYQELLPDGTVHYETGERSGAEYTALGLPVNNTLELPLLPALRVKVGDTWKTSKQRLDIPGLSPAQQPKVEMKNEFVGLEYEGGYKTAKIHQSFTGGLPVKTLQFGPVEVLSPRVDFARDIYIAYEANLLIKTTRTLTIKGTTTSPIGAPPDNSAVGGGGGGRSFGGNGFGGGLGGPPSLGPGGPGGAPPGYPSGYLGAPGGPAGGSPRGGKQGSGYPAGYPGGQSGYSGYPGGGQGGSPRLGKQGGGLSALGAGSGASGAGPGLGAPGGQSGYPSGYPGAQGSFKGGGGQGGSYPGSGGAASDVPHAITLRAVTDTFIIPSASSIASEEKPKSGVRTVSKTTKRATSGKRTKNH